MSTEFLDDGDLERLTGEIRPNRQILWLRENGYAFVVNSKGRPAVYHRDGQPIKTKRPSPAKGLLSQDTIVGRAIPVKQDSGVYFLISGSEVIYVGKSLHVMERIANHIRNGDISFEAFHYIRVSPERLNAVEWAYIKAFKPRMNTVGK